MSFGLHKYFLKFTSFFVFPDKLENNLAIFKYILLTFLGWRAALFLITFLGLGALPNADIYKHQIFFPSLNLDYWSRWSNWDGRAYQDVVQNGYNAVTIVFFPAYPLLIKGLTLLKVPYFWAGFLLSQIFTILAMFYLYKLAVLEFGEKTAKRAIFALLIFPASFYLVTLYNESLTLFTATAALYCARTKRWLPAAILAGIASVTRLAGVAVIIGVFAEYFLSSALRFNLSFLWKTWNRRIFVYSLLFVILLNNFQPVFLSTKNFLASGVIATLLEPSNWVSSVLGAIVFLELMKIMVLNISWKKVFKKEFYYLLLSLLPLILFAIYQQKQFGSPVSFLDGETRWGKFISLPWQGPVYNLGFLFSNFFAIGEYSSRVHLRFLIFSALAVGWIISWYKLRISYVLFYLGALLIPLFSGSLIDFPRYSLIISPFFLLLGMIENEFWQKIGIMLSLLLLSMLSILYFNNYFFM